MARVENLLGALSITMADRFRDVGAAYRMSASEQASLVTLLAHPDRPVSWLGEVLGLTSSGVTRLVDRLVARGWVTRTPGTDARHRRLRLTSSGTKRARSLNRDREAVLADAVAGLTDADRADLERLLDDRGRCPPRGLHVDRAHLPVVRSHGLSLQRTPVPPRPHGADRCLTRRPL